MKLIEWNKDKNVKLKKERGVSFDQIESAIREGKVLDIIDNPSSNFPGQDVYVIEMKGYIYYIPFVEDETKIFLKTIIPSRKGTKKYLYRK